MVTKIPLSQGQESSRGIMGRAKIILEKYQKRMKELMEQGWPENKAKKKAFEEFLWELRTKN